MGPCTVGRVTATHTFNLDSSMLSPRAVCGLSPRSSSRPHRFPFRKKPTFRTHSTHNFFLVSHHMYTTVKHVSACLINTDIDLMQHANLLLVVEGKLRGRLQLALAALAQPHLTQRLQQHVFPTARLWRCGACKGMARHVLQSAGGGFYARFSCRFICAAAVNLPACWFTSAISQIQLPRRARDRQIMLSYGSLSGAGWKKLAAK
jgi:hypothetical protein